MRTLAKDIYCLDCLYLVDHIRVTVTDDEEQALH